MKIVDLLDITAIAPEMSARSKAQALEEMVDLLLRAHPQLVRSEVLSVLAEREELGSTGIGDGVAIPHGKLKGIDRLLMAFGRQRTGIDFDAIDGRPAFLFFLLLAPENEATLHLKALARISKILRKDDVRRRLLAAPDAAVLREIISQEDGAV